MGTIDCGALVAGVVKQWQGVEVSPHRFGGVEFRVGKREIGHIHVGGVAGRARAHHTLPHSGWISFRLRTEHDVPAAVELFRLNYERLCGAGVRHISTPMQGQPHLLGDRVADDMPA
jgi:hypothetical protein